MAMVTVAWKHPALLYSWRIPMEMAGMGCTGDQAGRCACRLRVVSQRQVQNKLQDDFSYRMVLRCTSPFVLQMEH